MRQFSFSRQLTPTYQIVERVTKRLRELSKTKPEVPEKFFDNTIEDFAARYRHALLCMIAEEECGDRWDWEAVVHASGNVIFRVKGEKNSHDPLKQISEEFG